MSAPTTTTAPTTAERIRGLCERVTADAMLAIDGSAPTPVTFHHLHDDGQLTIAVAEDSTASTLAWLAGNGGVPAMLELTDRSPLSLREPVRSLAWLTGAVFPLCPEHVRELAEQIATVNPHPALLDVGHTTTLLTLRLQSTVIADTTGAEPVDVDELLRAPSDPFTEVEAAWLTHLDEDHPEIVASLARTLPPHLRRGRVRPLSICRYGIGLRIEGAATKTVPGTDRDVWLPFPEPVTDATALSRAIRVMMGCPFLNGLRARS